MSAPTRARLKQLIIEHLKLEGMTPEMIEDDAPLFGEGLGLDSVDALELVVALQKEWGLRIEGADANRETFASVATLAALVDRLRPAAP
jgi:acyl carrier protein